MSMEYSYCLVLSSITIIVMIMIIVKNTDSRAALSRSVADSCKDSDNSANFVSWYCFTSY